MADLMHIDWEMMRQSISYREKICKLLYEDESLKAQITRNVVHFKGTQEEAIEIFQESIVRFLKKATLDFNLKIEGSIEAYIYGISRLVLLSKRKKENKLDIVDADITSIAIADEQIDEMEYLRNKKLYDLILKHSTDVCRQILIYWSQNFKMEKIADLMGYKSEMMARKKKYECIQRMIDFFNKNPNITKYISDEY